MNEGSKNETDKVNKKEEKMVLSLFYVLSLRKAVIIKCNSGDYFIYRNLERSLFQRSVVEATTEKKKKKKEERESRAD